MSTATAPSRETTVLHVGGLHYGDEKHVVERVLGGRPGVLAVDANPATRTATVTYDPSQTSVSDLRRRVLECGYPCAGQSVPGHICDPMAEHGAAPAAHDHAAIERADHADGHGHGGHAGMSMDSMVRDMRKRFVVALAFTIPIVLWSNVGKNLLGGELATPFGIDRDVWQFPAQPADRLVRVEHLLHRRRRRAKEQDAGHDGARRGGHRDRLVVLGRGHVLHRGRRLLRVGGHARHVRAARALV
jgi:copper chaperone CopZ